MSNRYLRALDEIAFQRERAQSALLVLSQGTLDLMEELTEGAIRAQLTLEEGTLPEKLRHALSFIEGEYEIGEDGRTFITQRVDGTEVIKMLFSIRRKAPSGAL